MKRPHINAEGLFQSDKYPMCPPGKVPLSVKDPTAQDLLWQYAQRRRAVDAEFAEDLEHVLKEAGYVPASPLPIAMRLPCPECGELHIDEDEFATKLHHTHSCQLCGLTWRPAVIATVGVRFLPGFKNDYIGKPARTLDSLSDEPSKGRYGGDFSPRLDHVLYGLPKKQVSPGVAVRIRNGLTNAGIFTLAQLTAITLYDLRKLKNLGKSSVTQIQQALANFGLMLAEHTP